MAFKTRYKTLNSDARNTSYKKMSTFAGPPCIDENQTYVTVCRKRTMNEQTINIKLQTTNNKLKNNSKHYNKL